MNRKKIVKPKPVYAWAAVWKCDGEVCLFVPFQRTRKSCVGATSFHLPACDKDLRPLRVLITPAKKGAKKK